MDHLSPEQRHRCMASIHGKDTKPEIVVRRYLWARGFRYRLNHPRLPGKPDIVLLRYHACIFVNGCFWHGHNIVLPHTPQSQGDSSPVSGEQLMENSDCCKIPTTHRDFWVKKILRNRERDEEVRRKLADMGWYSITVWECELKPAKREQTLQSLVYTLSHIWMKENARRHTRLPWQTEDEGLGMAAEEETTYN